MPSAPLPPHIVDFLKAANPAVIASNRPDGQPVSVATWYLLEDDRHILVNMDASRKRLTYLEQDPRVSLTVLGKDWYQHVSVQGSIVLTPDPERAGIDRISTHYTGNAYPDRTNARVDGLITIDSWHSWHIKD
ncbi:MAG: pyridoxamine 5'-phosphate oxidase family protein [Nakamurella sp.]